MALGDDRRGLSEATGIAILIGFTVIVTASVGVNVLVSSGVHEGPVQANFSYDYLGDANTLLVTHERGHELPAGDLLISGPKAEATWAALEGVNESERVTPGTVIQVSPQNAYGRAVQSNHKIKIFYVQGENRTRLSKWPE